MQNTQDHVLDGKMYWYIQGKFKEAKQAFQSAIEQDFKCVDAYSELASLENLHENYQSAIRLIDTAIDLNPDYTKAYYFKASFLLSNKKHHEASKCVRKAEQLLTLNKDVVEVYLAKSKVFDTLGKKDVALECCERVIQYSNEAKNNLYLPYSLYIKGNILLQEFPQQALECYDAILKINDSVAGVHNNRGKALAALEHKHDAIEAYIKASDLFRESQYYKYAIECCNRIIEIDDSNAQYFLKRSKIFKDFKSYDNALNDLDKAMTLDKSDQIQDLRQEVVNLKQLTAVNDTSLTKG